MRAYRDLLRRPGAPAFCLATLLGRLPMAMLPVGVVLLVRAGDRGYAAAGLISGTVALAGSVGSPLAGRLIDRYGQGRLLPLLVAGHLTGLVGLVLAVRAGAALPVLAAAAVLTGGSFPSLSSLARARWSHLLSGPAAGGEVATAYAYESVVDEVVFVAGPLLVTTVAVAVSPSVAMAVAGAALAAGALWLAAQRGTEPPPSRSGSAPTALRVAGVRVVVLACAGLGVTFGALDVGVVAVTERAGRPAAAGVLLGLVALGSATGGLWYGARRWRVSLARRLTLGCLLLAGCGSALQLSDRPLLLAAPALLTGIAIAPSLISAYGLVDRLVPAASRTEGLTWVGASVGVGVAAGAAVTGALVAPAGPLRALLVVPAGAVLAALAAGAGRSALAGTAPGREPAGVRTAQEAGAAPGRIG